MTDRSLSLRGRCAPSCLSRGPVRAFKGGKNFVIIIYYLHESFLYGGPKQTVPDTAFSAVFIPSHFMRNSVRLTLPTVGRKAASSEPNAEVRLRRCDARLPLCWFSPICDDCYFHSQLLCNHRGTKGGIALPAPRPHVAMRRISRIHRRTRFVILWSRGSASHSLYGPL